MKEELSPPEEPSRHEVFQQIISAAEQGREMQMARNERFVQAIDPLLFKPDLSMQDVWGVQKVRKSDERKEPEFFRLFELMPASDRVRWVNVLKFMIHDIAHVSYYTLQQHSMHVAYANDCDRDVESAPLPAVWQDFYHDALAFMPEYLTQMLHPYSFTKALAEMEARKKISEVEEVNVQSMIEIIARTLQLRFGQSDFVISTPEQRSPDFNEIVLDLHPTTLTTNPGMLWSVLYNLPKNACRELDSKQEVSHLSERVKNPDYRPKTTDRLWIQSRFLEDGNVTLINIADSGAGLRVDEILHAMQGIIRDGLLKEADLNRAITHVLQQWKTNPFAIRRLSIGDAFDMAAAARASGFSTRDRVESGATPSGMGLWGSVYLTKKMGGEILHTNLADGGALFTIILPNDAFKEPISPAHDIHRKISGIREQLLNGQLSMNFPSVSA